eukprot:299095-Rhodomonas_salina.1
MPTATESPMMRGAAFFALPAKEGRAHTPCDTRQVARHRFSLARCRVFALTGLVAHGREHGVHEHEGRDELQQQHLRTPAPTSALTPTCSTHP